MRVSLIKDCDIYFNYNLINKLFELSALKTYRFFKVLRSDCLTLVLNLKGLDCPLQRCAASVENADSAKLGNKNSLPPRLSDTDYQIENTM